MTPVSAGTRQAWSAQAVTRVGTVTRMVTLRVLTEARTSQETRRSRVSREAGIRRSHVSPGTPGSQGTRLALGTGSRGSRVTQVTQTTQGAVSLGSRATPQETRASRGSPGSLGSRATQETQVTRETRATQTRVPSHRRRPAVDTPPARPVWAAGGTRPARGMGRGCGEAASPHEGCARTAGHRHCRRQPPAASTPREAAAGAAEAALDERATGHVGLDGPGGRRDEWPR